MPEPLARQRLLNVPAPVLVLLVLMALVHAGFSVFTAEQREQFLLLFAFIPARYDASLSSDVAWPGGWAADVWTFVTYALIHNSWMHLIFNAVWLLAFGSPVARRFGASRFTAFMVATAAAGAATHLFFHFGELLPVVGASAAVSGAMAAAVRFVFQRHGPLASWREPSDEAYRVPAPRLLVALRDTRVLIFLLVWFGFNVLFALGSVGMLGLEGSVAWEAHIGGFLAGLLGFPLFDPVRTAAAASERENAG